MWIPGNSLGNFIQGENIERIKYRMLGFFSAAKEQKDHQSIIDLIDDLHDIFDIANEKMNSKVKLSCRSGCSTCCHEQVAHTIPEIFLIENFVRNNFTKGDLESLKNKAIDVTSRIGQDRWKRLPCIFLDEDICSVYKVRAFVCRAWNSTDVKSCKKLILGDNDRKPNQIPLPLALAKSYCDSISYGLKNINVQWQLIYPSFAMKTLLGNSSDSAEKWFRGETVFVETKESPSDI